MKSDDEFLTELNQLRKNFYGSWKRFFMFCIMGFVMALTVVGYWLGFIAVVAAFSQGLFGMYTQEKMRHLRCPKCGRPFLGESSLFSANKFNMANNRCWS